MKSFFKSLLPQWLRPSDTLSMVSRPVELRAQASWAVSCDVDYLKQYNDAYGKQAGDDVLQKVSEALSRSCRREDQVFMRGGKQFVMIVSGSTLEQARACAERHREAVEQLRICHESSPFGIVTVSMGIATITAARKTSAQEALDEADAALDRAKKAGRNRVAVSVGMALAA
jgi:diguanylate cyclase (GGDEF)-like protein